MAEGNNVDSRRQRLLDALRGSDLSIAEEVFKGMGDILNPEPVKIPEPVFREIFLPVFTAPLEHMPENALANWAGLTNNSTASVVNHLGEEIFQVPPVFNTAAINVDNREGASYSAFYQDFSENAQVNPMMSQMELIERVDHRLETNINNEKAQDTSAWQKIFAHYGLIKDDQAPAADGGTSSLNDAFE